jgi:hypothetical protein
VERSVGTRIVETMQLLAHHAHAYGQEARGEDLHGEWRVMEEDLRKTWERF